MPIVFYLAEDPESGKIIDDAFLTFSDNYPHFDNAGRRGKAEWHAQNVCDSWKLRLMDFDGPFSEYPWRLGFRKPKWANGPPPGITADRWAQRFKSTDELAAYRGGVEAGRTKSRRRGPSSGA
jgi:hypothetical protein